MAWTCPASSTSRSVSAAQAGTNFKHDIGLLDRREALDHVEDVRVDQEVLTESSIGTNRPAAHSEKAALALAASACTQTSSGSSRAAASAS